MKAGIFLSRAVFSSVPLKIFHTNEDIFGFENEQIGMQFRDLILADTACTKRIFPLPNSKKNRKSKNFR